MSLMNSLRIGRLLLEDPEYLTGRTSRKPDTEPNIGGSDPGLLARPSGNGICRRKATKMTQEFLNQLPRMQSSRNIYQDNFSGRPKRKDFLLVCYMGIFNLNYNSNIYK